MRRSVLSRLPFVQLGSDVRNVVYTTWLVDENIACTLAPEGATLWARNGLTPLTILSYEHGHFGPLFMRGLRRLFPSPRQSNWRLYLDEPPQAAPAVNTVVFIKNILDNPLYALTSRIASDSLPSHLANIRLNVHAAFVGAKIDSREGSAPNFRARFSRQQSAELPSAFQAFADSRVQLVERLTAQEAAITQLPDSNNLALAEIELRGDLTTVEPMRLQEPSLHCPFLSSLGVHSVPICFLLPEVRFKVLSEQLICPE